MCHTQYNIQILCIYHSYVCVCGGKLPARASTCASYTEWPLALLPETQWVCQERGLVGGAASAPRWAAGRESCVRRVRDRNKPADMYGHVWKHFTVYHGEMTDELPVAIENQNIQNLHLLSFDIERKKLDNFYFVLQQLNYDFQTWVFLCG